MTATAIASVRPTATADERRAALAELADLIDSEDAHDGAAPLSAVLTLIVPPLCAFPVARNPELACNWFNQLVGATAELRRYVSNEGDWLSAHDLLDTAGLREATDTRLRSDVDLWLTRLVAGRDL